MPRFRKQDPAQLADDDLLELIARGDEAAFGALYDRHATVAFSLALRLLGNRSAAEDLVQETFLSIWRGASTFSPDRGSVRTWVVSIVHHRGVDRLRSQAVGVRRDEAMRTEAVVADHRPDLTSDEAIARVQAGIVRDALDQLPDEQALALRLAYFGGFTHHEIAAMLELPLGTVKSRLRRALEQLRQLLSGVEGATR